MPQRTRRSIEVDEDMTFQRRTWAVERAGWAAMGVFIVAAALGLFAAGPLSSSTVRQPQGFAEVEYGRFARQRAPATIRIKLQAARPASDGLSIEVDDEFVDAYKISNIRPQPVQSSAVTQGMRFRFDAEGTPSTILFHVEPDRIGFFRPKVTIAGGEPVELPVIIYP
jgi:hypothetical protein